MYEELALPLTNSHGFGEFIRFDYQAESEFDMPLVVSPHTFNLRNPFYSRQALYFLEDVDCAIRMMVESPRDDSVSDEEWRHNTYRKFKRAADDCLFEYSLRHFYSKLTIRSDHQLEPQHTSRKVLRSVEGCEDKYVDVDDGHAGLLYPNAEQQFEDIYRNYVKLVYSKIDNRDYFEEGFGEWADIPLSGIFSEPFIFYTKPYTFDELNLISRIIPIDVGLIDNSVELDLKNKKRELFLSIYNSDYVDRVTNFPQDKWPKQEICKVNNTYNPVLLDFYFAGLSSLSSFVEFRNYYSVIEYFFEDATLTPPKKA